MDHLFPQLLPSVFSHNCCQLVALWFWWFPAVACLISGCSQVSFMVLDGSESSQLLLLPSNKFWTLQLLKFSLKIVGSCSSFSGSSAISAPCYSLFRPALFSSWLGLAFLWFNSNVASSSSISGFAYSKIQLGSSSSITFSSFFVFCFFFQFQTF